MEMKVNYQHLAIALNVIHVISSNLRMHFKKWFIGNNVPEKRNLESLALSSLPTCENSNFTGGAAE